MTLTQYKKIIKAMSREELEAHLFSLFSSSKPFKDIESSRFSETDNAVLLDQLKKKLDRVFWKNSFSLSECKGVLKDFTSRCVHEQTIALMNLYFASTATELSAAYGDFGDSFYDALENAAEKYLDYAKTDVEFFTEHETEFEEMVETAGNLGYGVQDGLMCMLDDARADVYGEEEE